MNIDDFEYFLVNEDGDVTPTPDFDVDDTLVYIVVDHVSRIIYLWKGENAPIRKKFVGSRAMGDKRTEVGFHYKTDVLEQGDETSKFLEAVGLSADEISSSSDEKDVVVGNAEMSYAEAAAAQGIELSDDDLQKFKQEAAGQPSHIARMGGIGMRPQRSFLTDPELMGGAGAGDATPAPVPTHATKREIKKQRQAVVKTIQKDLMKEAKTILDELGHPTGFTREMVVIGEKVYRAGGEEESVEFEELDNPIDGIFMVKEYTPRIIAENGQVKVIELLKATGGEVIMDENITQDLEDLTAMFQIELE